MNRRYLIHNEPFINYAYTRLSASTEEERFKLSPEEQKIFKSDRILNIFCKTATKEKLDYLLTKIGVEWAQVYADDMNVGMGAVVNCWDQAVWPEKQRDVIRAMTSGNVFVTSNREQMMSLQMAALNTATRMYSVSAYANDLIKRGRGFNKMKTYAESMDEAKEAYDEFVQVLLVQFNSYSWVEENMNLEPEELRVLCVLFHNRNKALAYHELLEGIELAGKYKYISKVLAKLAEKKLITSDATSSKLSAYKNKTFFMITGLGIERMVKYVNYVHELSFGRAKKRINKLF